jgi:hypothetical protein
MIFPKITLDIEALIVNGTSDIKAAKVAPAGTSAADLPQGAAENRLRLHLGIRHSRDAVRHPRHDRRLSDLGADHSSPHGGRPEHRGNAVEGAFPFLDLAETTGVASVFDQDLGGGVWSRICRAV